MKLRWPWVRSQPETPTEHIDRLEERIRQLEAGLNLHYRTEFTKAHPRNGRLDEVMPYLGIVLLPSDEGDHEL